MISLIFIYCLLVISAFAIAVLLEKKFEECIPMVFMWIVFIIFISGIIGFLYTGVFATFIIFGIVIIFSIIKGFAKPNRGGILWKRLLTPGLLIFTIGYWALAILNRGRLIYQWDEFSHWGDVVKVMFIYDDFGTVPEARMLFASYPPGMAIFQYFNTKINVILGGEGFSEWRIYHAYQIFTYSMFLPFVNKLDIKRPIRIIVICLVIFLTPAFFIDMFFSSVYIDTFLAVLFGVGIAFATSYDDEEPYYSIMSMSIVGMLVLTKAAGTYLAIVVAFLYVLRKWAAVGKLANDVRISEKKVIYDGVLPLIVSLFSILVPYELWHINVEVTGSYIVFAKPYSISTLIKAIAGKADSIYQEMWNLFIAKVGNTSIAIHNLGISATLIVVAVILFALICSINRIKDSCDRIEKSYHKIPFKVEIIVLVLSLLIYITGLGATYTFKLQEKDLPSFNRYIGIYFLGLFSYAICILVSCICEFKEEKEKKYIMLLIVAFICFAPSDTTMYFLSRQYTEDSISYRSQFNEIVNKINDNTGNNKSRIFLIEQQGIGTAWWPLHDIVRPNLINNNANGSDWTWSIEKDTDWPSKDITLVDLKDELMNNYDFVVIWKTDDYFNENYSSLFSDSSKIQDQSIYKVNKETGLLDYLE